MHRGASPAQLWTDGMLTVQSMLLLTPFLEWNFLLTSETTTFLLAAGLIKIKKKKFLSLK
jgi:hypothetical protein